MEQKQQPTMDVNTSSATVDEYSNDFQVVLVYFNSIVAFFSFLFGVFDFW
jgi:hypothetical protein